MRDAITFIADVTRSLTDSLAGPVIVDAGDRAAAFETPSQSALTIDGFTLRSGSTAGVFVNGSPPTTVQNCIIAGNAGDGIRVHDASAVVVFNNLIVANGRDGIAVSGSVAGSPNDQVLSSTIAGHAGRGISIGVLLPVCSSCLSGR